MDHENCISMIYIVKDGHHRISVARVNGQDFIDAHVIDVEVQEHAPAVTEAFKAHSFS
jgi:hypothetical protein